MKPKNSLRMYLRSLSKPQRKYLAARTETKENYISLVARGHRNASASLALRIQSVTNFKGEMDIISKTNRNALRELKKL